MAVVVQHWYVEWEYCNTITNTGPFLSLEEVWKYIVRDTTLMSESGYGQALEAINITERP